MINCSVLFVVCNFIHLVTKKVLCLSYNISLFTRMPSWVGSSIKCLIALEINISDLLAIYEGTKAIQMFATEKRLIVPSLITIENSAPKPQPSTLSIFTPPTPQGHQSFLEFAFLCFLIIPKIAFTSSFLYA